MAQTEVKCTRHHTPTNLTCARCERPACAKCLVWTEVGQKCRDCVYPRFSRERNPQLARALVIGAIALVVALALLSSLMGGGSDTDSAGPPTVEPRKEAAIGEKTTDGDITFVVDAFECQGKSLVTRGPPITALGRYCVLRLTATNSGTRPASYSSFGRTGTVLLDEQRRRYNPDQRASSLLQGQEGLSLTGPQMLNPGSEIKTALVFDVAEGVTPVTAELHGGPGSGVAVRVSPPPDPGK